MTDRQSYDPFAPPPPASLTGVVQPMVARDVVSITHGDTPSVDDGLDDLKKAELVAMADDLGVDSTGTKTDIIARLRAI